MNSEFFQNLSRRDRVALAVAAPVIAVLAAVLVLRSLTGGEGSAESRRDRTLEDITWLQAQAASLPARSGSCRTGTAGAPLAARAKQYGLVLASPPESGNGEVTLEISSASGGRVLDLLAELLCAGAAVTGMDLETVDDQGTVKGVVTLSGVVT